MVDPPDSPSWRSAMPTFPWTTPHSPTASPNRPPEPAGGATTQTMASRFILRSRWQTVAMLRQSLAVRRALLTTPGALGVSLVARPLRREYYTLSRWTDRDALNAFVRGDAHVAAMRRFGPAMADARFALWPTAAEADAPSWEDAFARLADAPPRPHQAPTRVG
ncbi:antibiotic biosynthesis monooxygenase [Frankia sp. AgPm24]|uniref:antibiotic biosynthesis monooxygenase n=1 Tax=Frankia sp. AgPm24 TaxID=631128 RepID=UPI00200D638E|nr:antibiotic biosynthesis monooxygenase [Frankia sp. AgPm24]